MDLTIDDFSRLTPDEIDNKSTADKNDFSDDSIDPSPAVTSNQLYKPFSKDDGRPLPIVKIISAI